VAVRVGHGRAPEIVGGHQRQRTGAQHVGVHRHGGYVVVHEIAAQPVPVAHGYGRGHGRVHGGRDVRPPARFPTAAQVVTVLMVVVMVVRRAPHRTITPVSGPERLGPGETTTTRSHVRRRRPNGRRERRRRELVPSTAYRPSHRGTDY